MVQVLVPVPVQETASVKTGRHMGGVTKQTSLQFSHGDPDIDKQTDMTNNITFLKFHWQEVIYTARFTMQTIFVGI